MKKRKKKSIMQIESTKNGFSRKPKGLKSKDNHASIRGQGLKGSIGALDEVLPCDLEATGPSSGSSLLQMHDVHIVRVSGSDVVSAALCLMNLNATQRGRDEDLEKKDKGKRKRATKYVEPFLPGISRPDGDNMCNSGVFSSEALEDSDNAVRPGCRFWKM
ncbi:hypothetical protein OROGR_009965 [Orobanche gracilis]